MNAGARRIFSGAARGAPFTVAGLAKLIERAGIEAKIGFKVHPHTRDALSRTTRAEQPGQAFTVLGPLKLVRH